MDSDRVKKENLTLENRRKEDRKLSKKEKAFAMGILSLDIAEFLGVAQILKVSLTKDTKDIEGDLEEGELEARDFILVYTDIVEKFMSLPRRPKKELCKLVEQAKRGD